MTRGDNVDQDGEDEKVEEKAKDTREIAKYTDEGWKKREGKMK